MTNMVKNPDGLVAVQHFNTNPATIKIEASGNVYSFVPQHNVSLGWIREEDLGSVLKVMARVCCGKTAVKFHLANELNVSIWQTGDRPK